MTNTAVALVEDLEEDFAATAVVEGRCIVPESQLAVGTAGEFVAGEEEPAVHSPSHGSGPSLQARMR